MSLVPANSMVVFDLSAPLLRIHRAIVTAGSVASWETLATEQEPPQDSSLSQRFSALLATIPEPLAPATPCALVLPDEGVFYQTVQLPVKDPKVIQKVLPLELEDLLPLSLDSYHIEWSMVAPSGDKGAEVLVSLFPAQSAKEALLVVRAAGFEPYVITTASAAAAHLLPYLSPTEVTTYAVLVLPIPSTGVAIATIINGAVRALEVVPNSEEDDIWPSIMRNVLSSCSKTETATCSLLAPSHSPWYPILEQQSLRVILPPGRALQLAPLVLTVPHDAVYLDCPSCVAGLAALESYPRDPVVNSRSGEMAFKVQLDPVFSAFRAGAWWIGTSAVTIVMVALLWIFSRGYAANALSSSIASTVRQVLKDPSIRDDQALLVFRNKLAELQAQLKDLGSVGKLSPLDALLAITKDFPLEDRVEIKSIQIVEKKISIEGTAPQSSVADAMERGLRKLRGTYCLVRKTTNNRGAEGISFTFDITLCD